MDIEPQETTAERKIAEKCEYGSETKQVAGQVAGRSYFELGDYGFKTVSHGPHDYNLEKSRMIRTAEDDTKLLFTYLITESPHNLLLSGKDARGRKTKNTIPGRLKTIELKIEPYPVISHQRNKPDNRKFLTYSRNVITSEDGVEEFYEGKYQSPTNNQSSQDFAKLALNSKIDENATMDLYERGKKGHIELNGVVADVFPPGVSSMPSERL